MNDANYKVLINIIGCVESGGQVYGNRRYDAYAAPYTNTKNEVTVTLGYSQLYGNRARNLIKLIYQTNPTAFAKIDTDGLIKCMIDKDWEAMKWNPNLKQKKLLIALIDSKVGHDCQDKLFKELLATYVSECESKYTKDVQAVMMYAECRHLGGQKPAERIFNRCNGNYSVDNIMASLKTDQNDTSNNNQIGDQKFWSRHEKCAEYVKKYAVAESKVNTMNKTWKLTNAQYKGIANLALQENGSAALAAEVSLMCNLTDLQTKYNNPYDYALKSGWFAKASYWMSNGKATSAQIATAKDVIENGNRVLPNYVNEHDCFSDISAATNNGKAINKKDRSQYKKGVTKIKNRYGATYTFYSFPSSVSDPFGYTDAAYKKITGKTTTPAVVTESDVDKLIKVAEGEVGYLEKKSNSQLDDKTANAGSGNYTKYWRDMDKTLQANAWCDCYISWCFKQTFGETEANRLLCGGLHSYYTPTSAQYFKNKGQWFSKPQPGDQIFFHNSTRICHTGIVYKVDSTTVYTIEGNTSAGSQVIPNGGGVCKKSYALNNSRISGYGRPKYNNAGTTTAKTEDGGTKLNTTVRKYGTVTARTTLNVRTWAGTDASLCSFSPLAHGVKVGICDTLKAKDGSEWYYIKYNGKYGFVSAKYIA